MSMDTTVSMSQDTTVSMSQDTTVSMSRDTAHSLKYAMTLNWIELLTPGYSRRR